MAWRRPHSCGCSFRAKVLGHDVWPLGRTRPHRAGGGRRRVAAALRLAECKQGAGVAPNLLRQRFLVDPLDRRHHLQHLHQVAWLAAVFRTRPGPHLLWLDRGPRRLDVAVPGMRAPNPAPRRVCGGRGGGEAGAGPHGGGATASAPVSSKMRSRGRARTTATFSSVFREHPLMPGERMGVRCGATRGAWERAHAPMKRPIPMSSSASSLDPVNECTTPRVRAEACSRIMPDGGNAVGPVRVVLTAAARGSASHTRTKSPPVLRLCRNMGRPNSSARANWRSKNCFCVSAAQNCVRS